MRENGTGAIYGPSRQPAGSGNPSTIARLPDPYPNRPARSSIHHSSITTHHSGFTLLELLLVLVILGFCTAIAAAKLGSLRTGQGVEQAVQQLQDQGRRCRALAGASSQPVRLRIDLGSATCAVAVLGADGRSAVPGDGLAEDLALYDGAEALTCTWTPAAGARTSDGLLSDRTSRTTGLVDLLWLPDGRNQAPGTLSVACGGRESAVIFSEARLPERVP